MRRVSVVGVSGSGKSTAASALAHALDAPHVELDAIYHQANWTPLATDAFRDEVTRTLERPRWVIDGNYSAVQDLIWTHADTVIWMDLPRRVVFPALLRRSLTRGLTRQELWNGNREELRSLWKTDPEENLLLWAWKKFPIYRKSYLLASGREDTPRFIRVRSRAELRDLLASIG